MPAKNAIRDDRQYRSAGDLRARQRVLQKELVAIKNRQAFETRSKQELSRPPSADPLERRTGPPLVQLPALEMTQSRPMFFLTFILTFGYFLCKL